MFSRHPDPSSPVVPLARAATPARSQFQRDAKREERERETGPNNESKSARMSDWVLPDAYSKDLKDENGEPMSKSEFKKRQKAAKKAKEQAEKAAAKAAKPQAQKKKAADDEDLDPAAYHANRLKFVEGRKEKGNNPYPHKVRRD